MNHARMYAALSRSLDDPHPDLVLPSEQNPLLTALAGAIHQGLGTSFDLAFDTLWGEFEECDSPDTRGTLEHLQIEHARLFLGPPRPLVPPYEHAFRQGRTVADGARMGAAYHRFGLEVAPEFRDLPDHACLLLEFMAHLLATGRLVEADRFHREYIADFLPRFADAVEEHTTNPFYVAVAQALRGLTALHDDRQEAVQESS